MLYRFSNPPIDMNVMIWHSQYSIKDWEVLLGRLGGRGMPRAAGP